MFEMLKANRINKLTKTHSEKLSDCSILMNIVNCMDAKQNLSPSEYSSFINVYNDISRRKEEQPTNLVQYQHRAFALACEIEWTADVPYKEVCGDATDIYYVYINMKPMIDDAINEIFTRFEEIVDNIYRKNGCDSYKAYVMGWEYLSRIILELIRSKSVYQDNYLIRHIHEMSSKNLMVDILQKFSFDEDKKSLIKQMGQMIDVAYDNCDTINKFFEMSTRSYLSLVGAASDMARANELLSWIENTRNIFNLIVKKTEG